VKVEAYKSNASGDPTGGKLIDKEFFVYRYFDVTDNNHKDGTIDFEKSFTDGLGKVYQEKPYKERMPASAKPTYEMASSGSPIGTNFEFHNTNVRFDPISILGERTDTLKIKTPKGDVAGSLTTRGTAIGTQDVYLPKSEFKASITRIVDQFPLFLGTDAFVGLFPADSNGNNRRSDEAGFDAKVTSLYNTIVSKIETQIFGGVSADATAALNIIDGTGAAGQVITWTNWARDVVASIANSSHAAGLTGAGVNVGGDKFATAIIRLGTIPAGHTLEIKFESSADNVTYAQIDTRTFTAADSNKTIDIKADGFTYLRVKSVQTGANPITYGVDFQRINPVTSGRGTPADAYWADFGKDTFATYNGATAASVLTGGYAKVENKLSAEQESWLFDAITNRSVADNPEARPGTVRENLDLMVTYIGNVAAADREAKLTNLLANALSHEITHDLGAIHLRDAVDDYILGDVMGTNGSSINAVAQFVTFKPLVEYALGLPVTDAEAQAIWDYYKTYEKLETYRHNNTAGPAPQHTVEENRIEAGVLRLYDAQPAIGLAPHRVNEINFAPTLADGAGNQSKTFQIYLFNAGGEDLTIDNVSLLRGTAGFSIESIGTLPLTLEHLETDTIDTSPMTKVITVRFDPSVVGEAMDVLRIRSDSFDGELTEIPLTGSAVSPFADVRVSFTNNNLGGQMLGAGAVNVANIGTIENVGSVALSISSLAVSPQFAITGLLSAVSPASPLVLQPSQSFTFGMSFDPSALGLQPGTFTLASNDPDMPLFSQGVVGTGLVDSGSNLQYGNDYVAVETGVVGSPVLRQKSDTMGNWTFFLPPSASVHHLIFDPASGLISSSYDITEASGQKTHLGLGDFMASTAPDSDGDGLPDDIELTIGTSIRKADTDGDGIRDFAELAQGLDPLSGIAVPTGVVSSVGTQGQAREVAIDLAADGTQRVYLATGSHGLAIVNATRISTPVLLGELDLPGENNSISVDGARALAAVAGGSAGLHLVDVSDPAKPKLIETVPFLKGAQSVELFDGLAYVATGDSLAVIDPATGEELSRIVAGPGRITDLAREGSMLYTIDDAHVLRAVEIGDGTLTLRGSLTIPNANGQLFVGNGIAYLAVGGGFQSGFITADVSNPAAPTLISDRDDATLPVSAIVANGSGLGITVGTPAGTQTHSLSVVSVTDPANTGAFITRFNLPAAPSSVALSGGVAFVADGTAGLQIVNFLSFDDNGLPPAVTISSPIADADAGTPGIQILEGASIPVRVNVADDVQVQRVDVLVNGNVVASDASFPFDFTVPAPALAPGVTRALVQVRAIDTGGNEGLSNVLSYGLIEDTFAPIVVTTIPPEGASIFFTKAITVRFNEPLDVSKLNAAGVHLIALGANDAVGGGDDTNVAVTLQTRAGGKELTIIPAVPFDTGKYRLTIDPAIISDRGGNALATPLTLNFTVRSASLIRPLSGTPAILRAPAANVGQEIGFKVDWDPSVTRVKFPTIDASGNVSSIIRTPSRVDAASKTAFFIVPDNANTGDLTIYGAPANGFTGFVNWNVTDGSVDLIGLDAAGTAFNDRLPGNGLYVDLDGNTSNGGKLESKKLFDLPVGTYELRFDLAGSQQGDSNDVAVSLGTVFSETVTRAATAAFTTETRTINVTTATSGRLLFDQLGADNKGALLGRVRLVNTTTGAILIDDNFDMTSDDTPLPLQIVPTLADIDVAIFGSNYRGQTVRLRGSGFIEGTSTINFGTAQVVDSSPFSGPDVFFGYTRENDGMNVVAPADAQFGPITVTTAGGTSAPLEISLTSLVATATRGTPANPLLPSANPGQVITIRGIGLDATTDVVFPTIDSAGNMGQRVVRPIAVKADGTEATLVVPVDAAGAGLLGIVGDRNNSSITLQIVPFIEDVDFMSIASDGSSAGVRLKGKGFVEGNNSSYTFGGVTVTDNAAGGPDVYAHYVHENDGVDLTLPTGGDDYHGTVTVTTAGGTSAPFS
ncbi:MAG: Ig-like domain-containing protein, partial [Chthoniobacteraceae bacterium]